MISPKVNSEICFVVIVILLSESSNNSCGCGVNLGQELAPLIQGKFSGCTLIRVFESMLSVLEFQPQKL
jgi:hypothetical protein